MRGRGRSISNGLTIPAFARAHADPVRARVAQCAARRNRTQASAERAADVAAMLAALRDHGGPAPRWSRVNGALAAPCAHAAGMLTTTQSTASWVADLRAEPRRHWVTATSAPCTSIAKPVRVEEPVEVDPRPMPTNLYDASYRWWRHEQLHRRALRDVSAALASFGGERDAVESEWFHNPPSSAEAFAAADDLEEVWLKDLVDADPTDTRPGWLRRRWRAMDRAAGMLDLAR